MKNDIYWLSTQDTRFSQNGTQSQLIYSPFHELDYGTILCWAANDLGEQLEPCTFHIIPAGEARECKGISELSLIQLIADFMGVK